MAQNQSDGDSRFPLAIRGHVRKRCQQRGIDEETIHMLYRHGKRTRKGDGFSFSATRETHERAQNELGSRRYGEIAHQIGGCYIVVTADLTSLKTVAWRRRRLRH